MNQTLSFAADAPGRAELARLRRKAHGGIWLEAAGTIALLLVAFALPSLITDRLLRLEWIYRAGLLATFAYVVVRQMQRRLLTPLRVVLSDDEMALAVERTSPEVKQALISSLQFDRELQSDVPHVESAALKAAVVADVRWRVAQIPFANAIDRVRVRRFALALAGAIAVFAAWGAIDARSLGLWAARNLALSSVEWPRYTSLSLAEGESSNVRLAQGDTLTVRVAVAGPVPDQLFVDYAFVGGERGSEIAPRTGEREFTWSIERVLADMKVTLQGGDSLPLAVTVTIVERPRIDDLQVTVTYPEYMERESEVAPPTEGELRLPKGSRLSFAGKSQKTLTDAFALFGSDVKIQFIVGVDRKSFVGDYAPRASGLLVIDVVDGDRYGAGAPPKLLLRVGDDKPPAIEFRLRGIGPSITGRARIPGELKIKDDFGLREVTTTARVVVDKPPERGQQAPPEVPFEKLDAGYTAPLTKNALRYETQALVDLTQWSPSPNETAPENRIRPGMLFSLRFQAKDNFGPGEPHLGSGETIVLRVVTSEKLIEELRRRQVEQKEELRRIIDEERRGLLELAENMSPAEAGDKRKLVESRLKMLARAQQSLGRRVALVGDLYQRILWEYENNRLWEPNQVREHEGKIPVPLQQLAKDAFQTTARQVDAYAASSDAATKAAAVEGYKNILERLQAVLKSMEDAESLAALIEVTRFVLKLQNAAILDARNRVEARETNIFDRKGAKDPKAPKEESKDPNAPRDQKEPKVPKEKENKGK